MGADMILSTLWRKREEGENIDVEAALQKMFEILREEENKDTFVKAFAYATGKDLEDIEPLVAEVMWECKKQDFGIQETYDTIIESYRKVIERLKSSLTCREVTEIWIPGLIGYTTGGPSWGENTETGSFWNTFLFDTDPEYARHPYADELYNAIFIDPSTFYKEQSKILTDETEKSKTKLSTLLTILEDESFGETDILETRNAMRSVILG